MAMIAKCTGLLHIPQSAFKRRLGIGMHGKEHVQRRAVKGFCVRRSMILEEGRNKKGARRGRPGAM